LTPGCDYVVASAAFSGSNGSDGLPPITTPITVDGNGATISSSGPSDGSGWRLLEIASSGKLGLSNVTINGFGPTGTGSSGAGGAILNDGTGSLTDVDFSGNKSGYTMSADGTTAIWGGAIANFGSLTVLGGTLASNDGVGSGGGLENVGKATVTGAIFDSNTGQYGGGIANYLGTLDIANTTIERNVAPGNLSSQPTLSWGGGIWNLGGLVSVSASRVTLNSAVADGGGIYNAGVAPTYHSTVTVVNTVVVANQPDNCAYADQPVKGCTA
jgi:hypothetical protein